MNIRITTAGTIKVTHRLRQHTESRLELALGRFSTRIRSVTVTFTPQGPKLHVCRIAVALRNEVSVEAAGPDLFSAADLATEHLKRRIARAIEAESDGEAGRAARAALARRNGR